MEMRDILQTLIEKMPLAFTLSEVVYEGGAPSDFRLKEINAAFTQKMGLKAPEVIGALMSEWLFEGRGEREHWFSEFFKIMASRGRKEFDEILVHRGEWYLVTAYAADERNLALLFHKTSKYKLASEAAKKEALEGRRAVELGERRIKSFFLNSPVSIIIYDVVGGGSTSEDFIIREVNPTCLEVERWRREDVIGKPIGVLRPGVDEFGLVDVLARVYKTGVSERYPAKVYREGGEARWFENVVYKLPAGEIVAVYNDVTESVKAKEALFAEKERLGVTLYSIGDGIIVTDEKGNIEMLNPIAERLTGWKQEEARGLALPRVFDIYSEATGRKRKNPVDAVFKTGGITGLANHTLLKSKDGVKRAIADSAAPIKDKDGAVLGVVLVFRDVTKERKVQEKIRRLSYMDPLTGLYNRTYFAKELAKVNQSGELPLTFIMGDLVGLKLINDVFGHQMGDRALVGISKMLKAALRETDIICRWGGDEFLVLLPNTTRETGQILCEGIKEAVKNINIGNIKINISLGCAEKTHPDEQIEDVLKRAEDSMYKSKLLDSKSYRSTILNSIKATLFEKSCETEKHGERIAFYCRKIGELMGLPTSELDELEILAMLHDVGKIAIDEKILQKAQKLTDAEMDAIKTHPEIGFRIASGIPETLGVAEYILSHHERWDGAGYPQGKAGEEIPLLSRILAVVDAFDAMTSERAYRKSVSKEAAIEELKENAGTQFDPGVVDVFVKYLQNERGA